MLTLHKPNRLQTGKCMCIDVNTLVEIKHSTNIKTVYLRCNMTCNFMNRTIQNRRLNYVKKLHMLMVLLLPYFSQGMDLIVGP